GYVRKLEKAADGTKDAVGFVLAINGKVESAEVYGSAALMRKMWPKMLRAAAIDALADLSPGKKFEPADPEAVKVFLADRATGQQNETTTTVNERFLVTVRTGATSVSIETREARTGSFIHRSVIAK